MTLRFNQIVTYLQPDEALTIIEFLDQVREVLMNTYGEQIEHKRREDCHSETTEWPPSTSPR